MTLKQQLNGEKLDGKLSHLPVLGWAMLFSRPICDIRMLRFILINNVLFNLLWVWISF